MTDQQFHIVALLAGIFILSLLSSLLIYYRGAAGRLPQFIDVRVFVYLMIALAVIAMVALALTALAFTLQFVEIFLPFCPAMLFFIPSSLNDTEKRILEQCQRVWLHFEMYECGCVGPGMNDYVEQPEELPDDVTDPDVIIYWHQTHDALEKFTSEE